MERSLIRSQLVTPLDRQLVARRDRFSFINGLGKASRRGRESVDRTLRASGYLAISGMLKERGFFFSPQEELIARDMLAVIAAENILGPRGRDNQTNKVLGYKKTIIEAEGRIETGIDSLPLEERERAVSMMSDLRQAMALYFTVAMNNSDERTTFTGLGYDLPKMLEMIVRGRRSRYGVSE